MKTKVLVSLVICLGFMFGLMGAQEKKVELTATWEELFPFKEITEWVGEEFIFLPIQAATQRFGYSHMCTNPKKPYKHLAYAKYAGKIIKVVDITPARGYEMWEVVFEVKDTGKKVYATNVSESVMDIGFLRDILTAGTMFMGKTLWYEGIELVLFDEASQEFISTKIKKWSPVRVMGIQPCTAPATNNARFIICSAATDEYGFVDVNLSGTNVGRRSRARGFETKFLLEDPRITHNWPVRVWSAIEWESVIIGMTAEQVRMSWGEPEKINRTSTAAGTRAQWVYPSGRYLYFVKGKLTTIQN